MDVVELGEEHRVAVIALWEQSGLTRPWNAPVVDFDRAMAGPSSAILGVLDGGGLIATAMVGHDGHRGWVYYLAVHPDRRGSGLGRQLMRAAEEWLGFRGVAKLQLMVRRENVSAMSFYERLAYEEQDVVVMGRWL